MSSYRSSYGSTESSGGYDGRYDRNRDRDRGPDRRRRRSRSRSRSRSPERNRRETDNGRRAETDVRSRDEDERVPTPPPAPRITKVSMEFNNPARKKPIAAPIKMKLATPTPQTNVPKIIPKASIFNDGSDEEPEEMPAEARMRMRNIGRDTPTSSGPNSFGKTKQGFCDPKGTLLKSMREAMEEPPSETSSKAPTTIYKL